MSRPGGNPEFGTKHKFEQVYDEPLAKKQLQVRLPQSQMDKLTAMSSEERNNLVRGAIGQALNGGIDRSDEDDALVRSCLRDVIALKQAAISREKKAKQPDQNLIAQWEDEVSRLFRLLEE